jgi:hypothetical protein
LRAVTAGESIAAPMSLTPNDRSRRWFGIVLRDVQFWVPVVVLIGGLFVLVWIH